jgi:folate-dependent phosphoribosylglycinamide formyltransferase PurN
MINPKIVLLAGKGLSTNILYNALKNDFTIDTIILEEPVGKKDLIKKRIKKLGVWKVAGQILFQLIIVPLLNLTAAKRKRGIMKNFSMDSSALPLEKTVQVQSVNDDSCLQLLQRMGPQLVIVNGTRIISKRILDSVSSSFINMHAGITPKYRGVHGAYWSLVNNDEKNCGVTIHLVDAGIDTGGVIFQKIITVGNKDNFVTYPLLQLGEGIPYMKKAIEDIVQHRIALSDGTKESRLWSHPSIWQYLFYRISKGKK